jgi:hypothetical protein
MAETVDADPRFAAVALPAMGGLPHLRVYVHKSRLEVIEQTSKSTAFERR